MKKFRSILIMALLVSLILGSLAACGGDDEQAQAPEAEPTQAEEAAPTQTLEPTDTPLPEPTDTPPPEPTTAPTATPTDTSAPPSEPDTGDMELDLGQLVGENEFSSYRSSMYINLQGSEAGEAFDETIEFMIEYTAEPLAQHITISGAGLEEEMDMDSIEMYQVGDTAYMQFGEEWMSFPAGEDESLTEGMITPDTLLEDTCGWKQEGDTEIRGIEVEHWTISKEDIEACAVDEGFGSIGELEEAYGDLYIAKKVNYVAQMDLVFAGENLDMDLGTTDEEANVTRMEIHFEMTDVNEPFTIEVPEEAMVGGGLPEDIPTPDDAEEVNSMFGMITFLSPSSPEDVAEFYKAEMPNNGWTEVSVEEMGGLYMLEYSKDGRTASLMINLDEDSGKTSVLITVEEPE